MTIEEILRNVLVGKTPQIYTIIHTNVFNQLIHLFVTLILASKLMRLTMEDFRFFTDLAFTDVMLRNLILVKRAGDKGWNYCEIHSDRRTWKDNPRWPPSYEVKLHCEV